MFLNQLDESNKRDFLKVCVHASLANGIFANEEKEMLFAYCREMNVKESIPEITETFDELIDRVNKNTNDKEKKIFLLEVLALVKSDGIYDEDERDFMRKILSGFDFSKEVLEKFNILLDKYIEIGKEIYTEIVK